MSKKRRHVPKMDSKIKNRSPRSMQAQKRRIENKGSKHKGRLDSQESM